MHTQRHLFPVKIRQIILSIFYDCSINVIVIVRIYHFYIEINVIILCTSLGFGIITIIFYPFERGTRYRQVSVEVGFTVLREKNLSTEV